MSEPFTDCCGHDAGNPPVTASRNTIESLFIFSDACSMAENLRSLGSVSVRRTWHHGLTRFLTSHCTRHHWTLRGSAAVSIGRYKRLDMPTRLPNVCGALPVSVMRQDVVACMELTA